MRYYKSYYADYRNPKYTEEKSIKEQHIKPYAVILAGGESRRMGTTDKPTMLLGDISLTEHVVNRITPQTDEIVISTNGNQQRFLATRQGIQLPLINDAYHPPRGPMGGILSAMTYMKTIKSGSKWLLSAPADCPFLPRNLSQTLMTAAFKHKVPLAYAHFKGKDHYLCSLWSTELYDSIEKHLKGDNYSVRHLLHTTPNIACQFECETHDPFFNINTLDDFEQAKSIMSNLTSTSSPAIHDGRK